MTIQSISARLLAATDADEILQCLSIGCAKKRNYSQVDLWDLTVGIFREWMPDNQTMFAPNGSETKLEDTPQYCALNADAGDSHFCCEYFRHLKLCFEAGNYQQYLDYDVDGELRRYGWREPYPLSKLRHYDCYDNDMRNKLITMLSEDDKKHLPLPPHPENVFSDSISIFRPLTRKLFNLQVEHAKEMGLSSTAVESEEVSDATLQVIATETLRTQIQRIHEFWKICRKQNKRLIHPLNVVVEAWLDDWIRNRISGTKPENRSKQISPKEFEDCSFAKAGKNLPIGFFRTQGEMVEDNPLQMELPGFNSFYESPIVSSLPLEIYEASDGIPAPAGRGAPLAQRLWISAMLAYPLAERQTGGEHKLDTTLRHFKEWGYPNNWHRTHCLPRIIQALHDLHNIRTRWKRRLWSLVQVFALPDYDAHLDDPLPLIVRLPDGMGGHGAMIDVNILRELGAVSAAQFRAWIRLAYIWDTAKRSNGGHRIYATRPQVMRNERNQVIDNRGNVIRGGSWNNPNAIWTGREEDNPAIERVPVLSDEHLIHLFFDDKPMTKATRRKRLYNARRELLEMEQKGIIVTQTDVLCPKTAFRGYRILEPRPNPDA